MTASRHRLVTFLFVGLMLAALASAIGLGIWNRVQDQRWQADYSLIEERLYMGGAVSEPPPQTHVVLNVCEVQDRYECEVHVWSCIPDGAPAPALAWVRKQVEFLDEHLRAGRTVFVHCWVGKSRSALVVTAYLMTKHGWSRDQALEYLRSKRPIAKPNGPFMELLFEWEGAMKKAAREPRPQTLAANSRSSFSRASKPGDGARPTAAKTVRHRLDQS